MTRAAVAAVRVKPPARRTQLERRETTRLKLLEAATDALVDRGYANATVQEICMRAEVSHGGLFRHFESTEALMVAVGEHVGDGHLASVRREFRRAVAHEDPLVLGMRLVREHCRSRENQAWYELAVAARTNPTLREALEPIARRYYAAIEELARELLPDLAERLGPMFPVLVDTIVCIFDGEVLHRFVTKHGAVDDARLALLEPLVRALGT